ncbi:hypothetical protein LguiA_026585 [Lonicera macranthoides]
MGGREEAELSGHMLIVLLEKIAQLLKVVQYSVKIIRVRFTNLESKLFFGRLHLAFEDSMSLAYKEETQKNLLTFSNANTQHALLCNISRCNTLLPQIDYLCSSTANLSTATATTKYDLGVWRSVTQDSFKYLDAAIERTAGADVCMSYAANLERMGSLFFCENPDLWKWITGQEQPPKAINIDLNSIVRVNIILDCVFRTRHYWWKRDSKWRIVREIESGYERDDRTRLRGYWPDYSYSASA